MKSETQTKENKMKFEIQSQNGETVSTHKTIAAAERKHQKDLAWRCGICGSNKGGWGKCRHGNHNRVCSSEHYNDRIVQVEN
jgi:hypothetical protein